MTKKQQKKTTNAVSILYNRYVKGHADRESAYEAERQNLVVGQQIYDLRHAAGMTQQELADLVGTTASLTTRSMS